MSNLTVSLVFSIYVSSFYRELMSIYMSWLVFIAMCASLHKIVAIKLINFWSLTQVFMLVFVILGGIMSNSLRPQIPSWCDPEWRSLMESSWSSDPVARPTFSEISQKLRKMAAAINVKWKLDLINIFSLFLTQCILFLLVRHGRKTNQWTIITACIFFYATMCFCSKEFFSGTWIFLEFPYMTLFFM